MSRLKQAINQATTNLEKARQAEALREATEVLLVCEHYDEQNVNCRLCRHFSTLRYQMTSLIAKAEHRAERRNG